MVEGVRRGKLMDFEEREGALWSHLETYDIQFPLSDKLQVFMNKVLGSFERDGFDKEAILRTAFRETAA